jgi:hypothetical protein
MARPNTVNATPPAPRHPFIWATCVCALATLLLAWPALGGAFLVNPNSDQYIAGYAFREFAANSLRDGHGVPLWNPYLFGGMPYVAAMHGDSFYPTFLLRLLLPTDVAMTWGFVLHMTLAGVFTYGFLRAANVQFQSARVGAVAYLLSGAVASYASPGHDGKLFVSTLLPAALWALVRGLRDGRRGAWGMLSLIVGMAVLSPHPQVLQYMLLVCGAYALFLTKRPSRLASEPAPPSRDPARPHPFPKLALALGAVVLGALMGAIQYLPVREYVPFSPRAVGKGYDYATSFSFPLEETINVYLPQFSGILEHYWGRNGIHLHSEYIGATVLVLALFAFGGGLVNRHRSHAWFWLATLIISLLWAWGGNTPFYQLVYAVVPGSTFFRAPSTILYVSAFSCSMLAAFGTERVLAGKGTVRYGIAWSLFALSVAVLATAGAFTNLAMALLGTGRAELIEANASHVVVGAWRSAIAVLALVGLMLGVARRMLKPALAGWLVLSVVALDLWSVERHYWRFSPRADQLYAEDDIIRFLKSQREPARVIALPLDDNMAPHDPFLVGDALMHFRIRTVLGYHGNEIGRYQELYGKNEGFRSIANPNFWSLTNARFFYTNTPGLPFEGARLAAGPVRNAAGTMTYLYELPGDHPAAWVVPLIVKLDDPTTKATVLNPLFDVKRVAIFDTASNIQGRPVNSLVPEPVAFGVEVTKYQPGAIDVTLGGPAPAGSALVVSENFYPGWTATVDGQPAAIARADVTLIGIELPLGARSVQLRFDSAPYHTGKLLTLLALGAAGLWWIIGFALDRRSATATATAGSVSLTATQG